MTDHELLVTYNEGYATDHITGLRAVWAAAQPPELLAVYNEAADHAAGLKAVRDEAHKPAAPPPAPEAAPTVTLTPAPSVG
jgi:hypothetical protein